MNSQPPASEEKPADEADELATKRYVDGSIRFNYLKIKGELDDEREKAPPPITRKMVEELIRIAIREFKIERDTERLKQESVESSKRIDRSMQWSIRFVSGVVGAAIMMFIVVAGSQCSELHERIRTLESNQSKTK